MDNYTVPSLIQDLQFLSGRDSDESDPEDSDDDGELEDNKGSDCEYITEEEHSQINRQLALMSFKE